MSCPETRPENLERRPHAVAVPSPPAALRARTAVQSPRTATLCDAVTKGCSRFVIAAVLLPQHLAAMTDCSDSHASVVVHVPDLTAATGVTEVVIDEAIVVRFDVVTAISCV